MMLSMVLATLGEVPPGDLRAISVPFASLVRSQTPAPMRYPPLPRIMGVQGTVIVELKVEADGRVSSTTALEGPALLRGAAEAHCLTWTFKPPMVDGKVIPVVTQVALPFQLNDQPVDGTVGEPKSMVVELRDFSSNTGVPIAIEELQAVIRKWASRNGITEVATSAAHPSETLFLSLGVQTLRTRDGCQLTQIMGRYSRWGDRTLESNATGGTPRVGFLHRVVGQRGDAGFQAASNKALERVLEGMLLLRPSEVGHGERMDGPPKGTQPIFLDFSNVRVRRQPAAPPYPTGARARGIQGTVVLELLIDLAGRPIEVEALEGPSELMLTAIRYALTWEFEPAILKGTPQFAKFRLFMPFRLKEPI